MATVRRLKTGIGKLDSQMQGGLKERSTTIVIGSAGAGKTIFAMQYLLEGLKEGESCLYITFEEKKEKVYSDMADFKWDFEKYEKKKKFIFLEYTPEQVKSLIEDGGGTIEQIITKRKVSRLVIDSVTSFSLLYSNELSRKEAGLSLFELIDKWNCTAVLTSQTAATEGSTLLESSSLGFEADNILFLYHSKVKGERIRALEILKMRGTKHTNKTIELDISPDGLKVKPEHVIKMDDR